MLNVEKLYNTQYYYRESQYSEWLNLSRFGIFFTEDKRLSTRIHKLYVLRFPQTKVTINMKTMVGMATMLCGNVNSFNKPRESSEVKSGSLCLVQRCGGKTKKAHVFVRVYRSSFEHYAVIYKDQKFSAQSGYISLKNCTVCKCEHKENQLRVTLNNFEGNGLIFECRTKSEVQDWIDALQPNVLPTPHPKYSISPSFLPVIPRTLLMPTLAEESESEEGE